MSENSLVYSSRKLKSLYGRFFPYVTTLGLCELQPRARREQRKYAVVVDALPTQAEFMAQLREHYNTPVEDVVGSAFDEIETLAEEIREWYDNMGENLQQSSKGEELDECAGVLEYIERPDFTESVSAKLEKQKVSVIPRPDVTSRRDRLDGAVDQLEAVKDCLRELIDSERGELEEKGKALFTEEEIDELEEAHDQIENAIDEMGNVSFPSMY